jgi:lysosomal alpha-mannosidase
MTLENRSDGSYLIRLEHIYDVGEDKVLSEPVTVSLKVIFKFFYKHCKSLKKYN